MIVFIAIAFLIAKLKRYSLKPAFTTYALYPLFLTELVYWFFQINIFLGNYVFLPFSPYIKNAYIIVLILPIVMYKLFKPALVGSGVILLGTAFNRIAIYSNGGKMPVYPTLSRLTGYFQEGSIGADSLHVLGDSSTKLKVFTDYIDIGWSILSIGDVLIHSFILIIVYFTIKAINQQNPEKLNIQ